MQNLCVLFGDPWNGQYDSVADRHGMKPVARVINPWILGSHVLAFQMHDAVSLLLMPASWLGCSGCADSVID